jgi:exopolysaccharide biosynthesis polyprenyl glycosylphosphotransferase
MGRGNEVGLQTEAAANKPPTPRSLIAIRAAADMAAVLLASWLGFALYTAMIEAGLLVRGIPSGAVYAGVALIVGAMVAGFGLLTGAYGDGTSVLDHREVSGAIRAVWLSAAVLFGLLFVFRAGSQFSRIVLLLTILLSIVTIVVGRRLLTPLFTGARHAGDRNRRVIIVGAGATGRLVMKKIVQVPTAGLKLLGFIDDLVPMDTTLSCMTRQGHKDRLEVAVLGRTWEIGEVIQQHRPHVVFVALADVPSECVDTLVASAQSSSVEVRLVPGLGELRADQLELNDLAAVPFLRRSPFNPIHPMDPVKRLLDLMLSGALLVVTAPLLLIVSLLIRADSKGPALFRQIRIGRGGRSFEILKLRTMYVESNRFADSPSDDSDPRVTRIGRWLRASGIDELPQLINVFRGEMSMVGPRPEMPYIVDQYTELEQTRLLVKPGITGLWQLGADRKAQIHHNLEYDIYYVRNRSPLLDTLILLETVILTFRLTVEKLAGTARARRSTPASDRSETIGVQASGPVRSFVLVVPDQRTGGKRTSFDSPSIAAARVAARSVPVKVLVAPGNLMRMHENLNSGTNDEADSSGDSPSVGPANSRRHNLEIVPYRDSRDLRTWLGRAEIVLTDLPNLSDNIETAVPGPIVYVDSDSPMTVDGTMVRGDGGQCETVVQVVLDALNGGSAPPAS